MRFIRVASKGVCADGRAIIQRRRKRKYCDSSNNASLTSLLPYPNSRLGQRGKGPQEMRRIWIAAGVAAVSFVQPLAAAEINDQGARKLRDDLSHYLPDEVRNGGFLTVIPSGERYEIKYDFAKLLGDIGSRDFSISGLTPFSVFAAPVNGGLWKLNSDSDLNVSIQGKMPDGKSTDLTYSVTDAVFSGIFDPAISYLRSGEMTSGPIRIVSKTGAEELEASFAAMNYSLTSTGAAIAGATDFRGKGAFSRFYERVTTAENPPIQIRAESLDFDVGVEGVVPEKIRNLVSFGLELVKNEKPSQAELAELKKLIRGAMPFFSSLSEKITFNRFVVASQIGDFELGKLDYTLAMTEPSEATRIGFGIGVENISAPPGLIPELYAQLVPEIAEIQMGITDLNFTRFVDTLMEIDLSTSGPLPEAQSARLGEAFLPDGQIKIDFPKVVAKSPLYDVEASGAMSGYPDQKDRYTLETSIFARDVDKLIQYFQQAAKADPQFNQVSFAVMMAKGMAKTEADGRLRWDIKFEDGKSLTVNGQVLQ